MATEAGGASPPADPTVVLDAGSPGLATVTAGRGGLRLIAVDQVAYAAGLRPGLTLADARALSPRLVVESADPPADRQALGGLADWCGRYTPWAAIDPDISHGGPFGGGAGLILDVSGCAHLFGGEVALLEELTSHLDRLGFAHTAAIAGSAGAAWAVARFGGARTVIVPDDGLVAVLQPLPVHSLRLPGEIAAALGRMGLRRIGDVLPLPRAPLAARFGDGLLRRLDQALGHIDEPISPRLPPPVLQARLAFAEPIGRSEDVAAAVDYLLVDLSTRLEAVGRGARRLVLTLYRVDGTLARIAIGTSRPTRAADHLRRLFREKLDGLNAGFGIEVATLAALVVDPLPPVQNWIGLDGADRCRQAESLAQLIDRLGNRLGTGAVVHLVPYPSHNPERAGRESPALARSPTLPTPSPCHAAGSPRDHRAGAGCGEGPDNADAHHSRQPRPLLLLASPEPIEVIAPVPDGPPALFRRGRIPHRIARAEGPERIGCEWWLFALGHRADDDRRVRDYWRVEDGDGRRFWIFREGLHQPDRPPRWWLHGLFP